jgi:outer membrane scaffolding protein for murein synthesis (MipA/OmpV family)
MFRAHVAAPRAARFSAALRRVALLGVLLAPAGAGAQEPLWEAGVGVAALSFPHYRGSDERRSWVLPYPYIVYRGDRLQVEEGRMRGIFYRSDRVELDVSLNGSVPVDSGENQARRGMPDLDATLEIGPVLNVSLWRSPDRLTHVRLRLPARAAIATDLSHARHVGWVFQPHLSLEVKDPLGHAGWKASFLAGPVYSDSRYHRYFYEVQPAFATASRPAYTPGGGYAGAQLLAALSKRYRRFWVGGFVKWDTLSGAVFEDSPLVKDRKGFAAGVSVAWILGESRTRVPATR